MQGEIQNFLKIFFVNERKVLKNILRLKSAYLVYSGVHKIKSLCHHRF
jgi:hypothetical protein